MRFDGREGLSVGGPNVGKEDGVLIAVAALNGNAGDANGMFVEVRPRPGHIGLAQRRTLGGHQGVGFGKERAPARLWLNTLTRLDNRRQLHRALHRRQRRKLAEVHQVADETTRQRQRYPTAGWLSHPFSLASV